LGLRAAAKRIPEEDVMQLTRATIGMLGLACSIALLGAASIVARSPAPTTSAAWVEARH
jgi:hypothetical protein